MTDRGVEGRDAHSTPWEGMVGEGGMDSIVNSTEGKLFSFFDFSVRV